MSSKRKKQQKKGEVGYEKLKKKEYEEEDAIIAELQRKIFSFDPEKDWNKFSQFSEFPLTEKIIKGLKNSGFISMTEIQKKVIPYVLKEQDVVGISKTGSGKTLSFLVPTLDILYKNHTNSHDGLAALIILPTRELAVQTFTVCKKIGQYMSFSVGLVVGGNDFNYEKERVSKLNILIGTPGRLLHLFRHTYGIETSNFKIAVLDEADRCLDMGFKKDIIDILNFLPKNRITLFFTATHTSDLNNLANISLKSPKKINVSVDDKNFTLPEGLSQSYVCISLDNKLNLLWSFIKFHLKKKILVFFSTSKQVQYVYKFFSSLQPGIQLLRLYGRNSQTSRLEVFRLFSKTQHCCLFSTDLVARGLDFPGIDWVIQFDCPENVATYVHRIGRTARFNKSGDSLLFLTPSEKNIMLEKLKSTSLNPTLMKIKDKNIKNIKKHLQSLCIKNPEFKTLAQKTFISYLKSVYMQNDKDIFKIDELDTQKYAESLGLLSALKIKFIDTLQKQKKNQSKVLLNLKKSDEDEKDKSSIKSDTLSDKSNKKSTTNYLSDLKTTCDSDDDFGFMNLKRKNHDLDDSSLTLPCYSKKQLKKAHLKKTFLNLKGHPTKIKFDDDDIANPVHHFQTESDFVNTGDLDEQIKSFVKHQTENLIDADLNDKEFEKDKKMEKKIKLKKKLGRSNLKTDFDHVGDS